MTAALASPPGAFHPTNLVDEAEFKAPVHVNGDRIKFKTKEPVDVRVQTVTFDPHGFSGWHHHPGIVIVAVKSGTLTVFDADCNATTYGPGPNGSVFVESGDEPGEVRNLTNEAVTVYATFVAPDGDAGVPASRTCRFPAHDPRRTVACGLLMQPHGDRDAPRGPVHGQ